MKNKTPKMIISTVCMTMCISTNYTYSQTKVNSEAEVFMPQLVCTEYPERDMTISPDGKTAFFTLQTYQFEKQAIVRINKTENGWTEPVVASFSGMYNDLEPSYSPDGKRLYFSSNRPLEKEVAKSDFDIWYVEPDEDNNWSEPIHLDNIVNSTSNEFYPSVVEDGSIYFTASYEDSKGFEDIYYSHWNGQSFDKPVSLDSAVNTAFYEFNAYISPDDKYIIFSSYGRPDDMGGGDLYMSRKNNNGQWMEAKNLGEAVNSASLDYCPFISPDGKHLFFTSNRNQYDQLTDQFSVDNLKQAMHNIFNGHGNIFRISSDIIFETNQN